MKVDIYTVSKLMEISDDLIEYLGEEQGNKVIANLMVAGDKCREAFEILKRHTDDISEKKWTKFDAIWVKFISSWIASYWLWNCFLCVKTCEPFEEMKLKIKEDC